MERAEAKTRIKALTEQLNAANYKYYVLDNPERSEEHTSELQSRI